MSEQQIAKIIELIQKSELDQIIKDILIRDLHQDGLTDFLKEQIQSYCDTDEINKILNTNE